MNEKLNDEAGNSEAFLIALINSSEDLNLVG